MIHIKKMMCVCAVFCTVTARISPLFGAFEYNGLGWPAAMANIMCLGQHPQHFAINPALLDDTGNWQFVLSYQNPFQSLDIQAGSVTFQNSIRQKPYIHNVMYFGDALYSELKWSGGSAWTIQQGYRAGATLTFHRLSLSDINIKQSLTISLSNYAELSEHFRVGSVMEHVIQWGRTLTIPQKFHIGGEYRAGPARLIVAAEKESALPLETCLGLQLSMNPLWQIAIGYRDLSGMMSAGWRIYTGKIAIHYVCVSHPQLPLSHGFGLELMLP